MRGQKYYGGDYISRIIDAGGATIEFMRNARNEKNNLKKYDILKTPVIGFLELLIYLTKD